MTVFTRLNKSNLHDKKDSPFPSLNTIVTLLHTIKNAKTSSYITWVTEAGEIFMWHPIKEEIVIPSDGEMRPASNSETDLEDLTNF